MQFIQQVNSFFKNTQGQLKFLNETIKKNQKGSSINLETEIKNRIKVHLNNIINECNLLLMKLENNK